MFERLAVSLTGLCQRVDRVTVQEFVDCSGLTEPKMLMELMGMGKQPEEISVASPMFRAVSVQYEQALAAAAETLHLAVDEIRHEIRTATVADDVPVACGTLPAGSVVGQIMSWSAYHEGRPKLVAEEYWKCTDVPEWDLAADDQFLVRVIVEGAPNLTVDLRVDRAPIPEFGDVSGGHLAVAMSAVHAIPYVRASPPGVVVPEVFGAYRFT
jgi:hypothetical protein